MDRTQFVRSALTIDLSRISNRTFIGRILRAPLRLIPPNIAVPILQGPLRGKKWIAGSSSHGCWLGTYEMEKQLAFRDTIKSGQIVYDIGANVGFYTLLASLCVGPAGRVYSFEPLPRNVSDLEKHVAMNRLTNCELIEAAVSDVNGYAQFDSSRPRSMGWLSDAGNQTVRILSLDSLVSSKTILPPNVMKIDVEGAELRVLQGCVQVIDAYSPIIFLATHGPLAHDQCVQFLTIRNYRIQPVNSLSVECGDELLAIR